MAKELTPKQQKELNSLMEEFLKLQEKMIKNGRLGVKQQERYEIIQKRINVLHKEDLHVTEEKKKPKTKKPLRLFFRIEANKLTPLTSDLFHSTFFHKNQVL